MYGPVLGLGCTFSLNHHAPASITFAVSVSSEVQRILDMYGVLVWRTTAEARIVLSIACYLSMHYVHILIPGIVDAPRTVFT